MARPPCEAQVFLGRPLATDGNALRRLYEARLPAYRSADLTVAVGADETPAAVVDRILLCLREIA